MVSLREVLGWLERDLSRFSRLEDHFVISELGPDSLFVEFFTDANHYSLSIGETSMSCWSESRKPRAGEKRPRGNVIVDGPTSEETWHKVIGHILSYEIVRLAKKPSTPQEKSSG